MDYADVDSIRVLLLHYILNGDYPDWRTLPQKVYNQQSQKILVNLDSEINSSYVILRITVWGYKRRERVHYLYDSLQYN